MSNVTGTVTFTPADLKRIRERTVWEVFEEDEADAIRQDDYTEQTEPDYA